MPYEVATTRTLLGQALRDAGDEAGAAAAFDGAVELFDDIGAHLDARLVLDDAAAEPPRRASPSGRSRCSASSPAG